MIDKNNTNTGLIIIIIITIHVIYGIEGNLLSGGIPPVSVGSVPSNLAYLSLAYNRYCRFLCPSKYI